MEMQSKRKNLDNTSSVPGVVDATPFIQALQRVAKALLSEKKTPTKRTVHGLFWKSPEWDGT